MQAKKTLVILVAIALISCNPQRKLQRLINKHPELITQVTDTIRVKQTFVLPGESASKPFDSISKGSRVEVRTKRASAVLVVDQSGAGDLQVISHPDTLQSEATIPLQRLQLPKSVIQQKPKIIEFFGRYWCIITLAILFLLFRPRNPN